MRVLPRIIALIFALAANSVALAQVVDPQNVLITNVFIVTGEEEEEPKPVNVLVRDNKLDLVSPDEVPVPDGVVAVDAEGGYLLGTLKLGAEPSFLILDADPRADVDVLLDTAKHAVFAVHGGELRKNTLLEALPEDAPTEAEVAGRGWMAYSPPPLAMPVGYLDTDKWNRWDTRWVDGLFVAGLVLDRVHFPSQNAASEQQVGDLSLFEGGEIRGLRVGAVGTINFDKPWVYTVFGATHAFDRGYEVGRTDDFTWFDYRLDIPLFEKINLSVGKQKEPISMERIMSMIQLPMQERTSGSDALLPSRNFGVVFSSTWLNERGTWAGGVFNNFIDSGESIGSTATQWIGRATWLPFLTQDESHLVHLGVGLRQTNAKNGLQYLTEPEINKAPVFVDTGLFEARDALQYNLEASWRYGPYWVHAEYTGTNVDSVNNGDLSFSGYHIAASWIISGEMRRYNKKAGILGPIPVAKTVYQGGWGAWEVAARYSSVDLTDGGIDGGEMDILSLGANWWLTPFFNLNLNYRFIENNRDGLDGESSGFIGRVTLLLE